MNMRTVIHIFTLAIIATLFGQCKKDKTPEPLPEDTKKIEVVFNEIPYPTEKFLRIGYTLKMWEYEKDGYRLKKIVVLDTVTKAELLTLTETEMTNIIKDSVPPIPYFTWDSLTHYYLSIQIPVPLGQAKPLHLSHRFEFRDTLQNKEVTLERAYFSPRINENPVVIASPVKGKNWIFASQSTMGYHFFVLLFMSGDSWRPERFAFDNAQFDDNLTNILNGDPMKNESYFNYGDTLYAVADGKVAALQDGLAENNGNTHDAVIHALNEYSGNFLILDIGGSHYAAYGHCIPGSFFVASGDSVKEGQPVARLGNSGNSGMPHLHFQVVDRPDFLFSQGIPFVLKEYKKINEFDYSGNLLNPPVVTVTSSMMEELSVISFE